MIEEGEVEVDLPGRVVVLGAGEFFGEVALLTDRTRTGRVRTITDVRCRALARSDFTHLLAEQPGDRGAHVAGAGEQARRAT